MTEAEINQIVDRYKEDILGECMLKVDSIHPETISSDHDARNYLAGYIADVLEKVIALVTDK